MINEYSNIAVSVIVPAYNVEEYIVSCIETIINQTFKNIELILIDDCSTDETLSVIKKYLNDKKIKKITLLENDKNMGAGYSRNRGLDIAKGEYLLFLDSDDFFELDMIEKLYLKCEECRADIIICNYYWFDNQTGKSYEYDNMQGITMQQETFQLSQIKEFAFQHIQEVAWNKMFRRNFIKKNKIRFQCQHNANDQFFVFASVLRAQCIVEIKDYLLSYRKNLKKQLSASISKDPMCIWKATQATLDYMDEMNQYDLYRKSFNTYIVNRLLFSLQSIDEADGKQLFKFYQETGFGRLRIKDSRPEDFSVPYFYAKWKWLVGLDCLTDINEPNVREISWNGDKLKELYKQLQKERNIVLWGVGINGKNFLEESLNYKLNIRCVIDQDEQKHGEVVCGYEIESKKKLENGDLIIVLNPFHIAMIQREIKAQQRKAKLLDARAFLCFDIEFEQSIIKESGENCITDSLLG